MNTNKDGVIFFFFFRAAPPLASCNFDTGLCSGWYQFSYSDVFDWTRHTGATPSYDTGPSSDHTSGSGKFISIKLHRLHFKLEDYVMYRDFAGFCCKPYAKLYK